MNFLGQEEDINDSSDKTGVLLINLGTPDQPKTSALRRYLSEFLMDPRVIEIPRLFRLILVRGLIVNFRSHKSAKIYRDVWTNDGSPLLLNTEALADDVAHLLGGDYAIEVAMRYGNPSIAKKLLKLHRQGVRKLIVIPLYPQYSGSTSGSTFDAVSKALSKQRWIPDLHFISAYYQRDSYIRAIGDSVKAHWMNQGRAQKLIMSFHGVPQKYTVRGDPYQSQCQQSAQRIADYLELYDDQWQLVFQSRFGAQEWLKPYCNETLKSLPAQGITSIDIICPGFSVDCLETLEEIKVENRDYFMNAGGEQYCYIPCLNDAAPHTALMAEIIFDQS